LDSGFSHDERVGKRADIRIGVADDPGVLLEDARRAKAKVTVDLMHIDTKPRFEPDAVVVDDADYGDRNLEQLRGNRRYAVKRDIPRRIENFIAADGCQPLQLSHFALLHFKQLFRQPLSFLVES
jgi:hypothetical protein